jgi:alpha-1,2-mannosyltransferase
MTVGSVAIGTSGLRAAAGLLLPPLFFILLPAITLGLLLDSSLGLGSGLAYWDLHALWNAGHSVLEGHSPYGPSDAAALAGQQAFVYPAPAALAATPLALLPFGAAGPIFLLLSLGALLLALRLAGVEDWRVYGIALLSEPVLHGLSLGAVSPFLALGVAAAWRWRDRRWVAGAAIAALIVVKIYLWPLLLWLAFTRRLGAAVIAAGLAVATSVAAWAVLGFAGLRGYPHMLELLSRLVEGKGYSLVALALSLGAGVTVARGLGAMVAIALLALVAVRGRREGADTWTLAVAIGASLALTPIVWLHYFVLLLVPLAIASPRLGPLWLVPVAFCAVGGQSTDPPVWSGGRSSPPTGLESPAVGETRHVVFGILVALAILLASTLAGRAHPRPSLARDNA